MTSKETAAEGYRRGVGGAPGTLKHPIDRYERRKYDSSIVCMVPGCKRPAAYGCGAGFPLCEGHYLAEVERVRRDGGRPA